MCALSHRLHQAHLRNAHAWRRRRCRRTKRIPEVRSCRSNCPRKRKGSPPFGDQKAIVEQAVTKDPTDAPSRKMKLNNILDQNDESEFHVQSEEMREKWYAQYIKMVGGLPPEEEDPTLEQLSALHAEEIGYPEHCPFCGPGSVCAVWPRRTESLQIQVPCPDEQWVRDEGTARAFLFLPMAHLLSPAEDGSHHVGLRKPCLTIWAYEATIERLSRSYPTCWHLIYSADEVARSAQSNRIRSKIIMDIRAGRPGPEGFTENRPWDYIFGAVAWDESFWQVQVHAPALAWIAAGSQGVPRTPAEQLASGHMQGGMSAITPVVESYQGTKGNHGGDPRRKKRPRGRRGSSAGEDSKQRSSQGEKGKGKGGGKGTNNQRCFS